MSQNTELPQSLPLVTVVTVTWNIIRAEREKFLLACIESVHNQDYPHIEHLIIDGASDDGTIELLSKYEKEGWITCHSEPDTGIYDAMNKGISKAKGKYIAFLNSDDYWHDSSGISQSVRLLEDSQADFSYAPRKIINEDGTLLAYEEANLAVLFTRMPFCHQTMFTRTDLIRKLNGFANNRLKISADYDLVTRTLLSGAKPVFVPCCFTSFRLGGASSAGEAVMAEFLAIHKHNYGNYVDEADIPEIRKGVVPTYLLTCLRSFFHPSIIAELDKSAVSQGRITILPNKLQRNSVPNPVPSESSNGEKESAKQTSYTVYYRFLALPVVSIKHRTNDKTIRLLGIPFFRIRKKSDACRIREVVKFIGIPVMTYVTNDSSYKLKLFGFIPLLTIKKR